jgi:putative transposase
MHRKQLRRFHVVGDLHELTFSCYRRLPLLTNNPWRVEFARAIDQAGDTYDFHLVAFVFMPEHVHLLVYPQAEPAVPEYLSSIKRPVSVLAKANLIASQSRLLEKLVIRDRPGRRVFRFWQEGAGFDRNLFTAKAITAAIDYIHLNPVRRGLVKEARQWRWSSARYYLSDGQHIDPELPRIQPLPAEYWQSIEG